MSGPENTSGVGTSPANPASPENSTVGNIPPANTVNQEVTFNFKSTTNKETKEVIPARPKLTLQIPVPTFNGVIAALSSEPADNAVIQNYLMRLVKDDIITAARYQVSDDEKPVMDQESLDLSKLTLHFLATQPESERRGGGIPKETWEAFETCYVAVKTAAGKDAEKATNAAKLFVKKLQPIRTQKQILNFLRNELDSWFTAASKDQQEEFSSIYEYLMKKADDFLKADEASLLANL